MKVFERLPRREIEHYGSHGFTHSRLALGETYVSLAELDGTIGGHPAASQQLLVVLRGSATVSTRDDEAELGEGGAVLWDAGEWHETRGRALLLLVEGVFETFVT
jgi:mannose-6-phosphate isomerase-like protein (cupin superfamily)